MMEICFRATDGGSDGTQDFAVYNPIAVLTVGCRSSRAPCELENVESDHTLYVSPYGGQIFNGTTMDPFTLELVTTGCTDSSDSGCKIMIVDPLYECSTIGESDSVLAIDFAITANFTNHEFDTEGVKSQYTSILFNNVFISYASRYRICFWSGNPMERDLQEYYVVNAGMLYLSGPHQGQQYSGITGRPLLVKVLGEGLPNTARIQIVGEVETCGTSTALSLTSDLMPLPPGSPTAASPTMLDFELTIVARATFKVCYHPNPPLPYGPQNRTEFYVEVGYVTIKGYKTFGNVELLGGCNAPLVNPTLLTDETQTTGVCSIEQTVGGCVDDGVHCKCHATILVGQDASGCVASTGVCACPARLHTLTISNNDRITRNESEVKLPCGFDTIMKTPVAVVNQPMGYQMDAEENLIRGKSYVYILDSNRVSRFLSDFSETSCTNPALAVCFPSDCQDNTEKNNMGFNNPQGLAVAARSSGEQKRDLVLIADTKNHRVVVLESQSSSNAPPLTYLGQFGITYKIQRDDNGLNNPRSVVYAPPHDMLFVADYSNHRVVALAIRDFGGLDWVCQFGLTGVPKKTEVGLTYPTSVSFYENIVYVGEWNSARIVALDARKLLTGVTTLPFYSSLILEGSTSSRGIIPKVDTIETAGLRRLMDASNTLADPVMFETMQHSRRLETHASSTTTTTSTTTRLTAAPIKKGWVYISYEAKGYSDNFAFVSTSMKESVGAPNISYVLDLQGALVKTFILNSDMGTSTRPTNLGSVVDTWTIHPIPPDGISIDPETGILSGIPKDVSPPTWYSVMATNVASESNTSFPFAVTCQGGFYFDQNLTKKCQPCSQGSYRPFTRSDLLYTCLSCSSIRGPGFTTAAKGSTDITNCVCDKGFSFKNDACTPCSVGEYIDQYGPVEKCNKCPPGTTTQGLGTDDTEKCVCIAGKYLDEDLKCDDCPVGHYCPEKGTVYDVRSKKLQSKCEKTTCHQWRKCPSGKSTSDVSGNPVGGKISEDECVCAAGFEPEDIGYISSLSRCVHCPPTHFKARVANEPCGEDKGGTLTKVACPTSPARPYPYALGTKCCENQPTAQGKYEVLCPDTMCAVFTASL